MEFKIIHLVILFYIRIWIVVIQVGLLLRVILFESCYYFYPADHSSSLEKRSSEIPIPRSREHSGPDQRPIDNVQTKMRKCNKNFSKGLNENKKHFSLIETSCTFDNNACLFDDDEGLAGKFIITKLIIIIIIIWSIFL